MLVSRIIDYIKLGTRTLMTDITDHELMSLLEISLNKIYLDLELNIMSQSISINVETTFITVKNLINTLKAEITYDTNKTKYILLNDMRDKELYLKQNSLTELELHIKDYKRVTSFYLVQLRTIDIDNIELTTEIENQYLTAILAYSAYSTYTLLGWKDMDTAEWHLNEYLREIETLKRMSHNTIKDNLILKVEPSIRDKGFV